jgi:hypothetical protein
MFLQDSSDLPLMDRRRLVDQEIRARKQEENQMDRLLGMEKMIQSQNEKIIHLEALVTNVTGPHVNPMSQKVSRESTTSDWSVRGRSPGKVEDRTRPVPADSRSYGDGSTATPPQPLRSDMFHESLYRPVGISGHDYK